MRAILWPKQKIWWLLFFCLLSMVTAISLAAAEESGPAPERDFWVWNQRSLPTGFRPVHATLRSAGARVLVYVEDSLWESEVPPSLATRLGYWLESSAPAGAYSPGRGILPIEESLFGALPNRLGKAENPLILLFARLGRGNDGYFNPCDQMSDAEAWTKLHLHSNEANVIYLNGFRRSEEFTAGIVAHELQRLLTTDPNRRPRESWFTETLAAGAKLVSGIFDAQSVVSQFAQETSVHPLVSLGNPHAGPTVLFSSFLLDNFPSLPQTALGALSQGERGDRGAVEALFLQQTGVPLSFDAIFSNFVSYVFAQSNGANTLPGGWPHARGITVPPIQAAYVYSATAHELTGELAPYSFAAIDLAQPLSPSTVVQVDPIPQGPPRSCSANASVLWKPVTRDRIGLYAVGCPPESGNDKVQFRLKILDRPSLLSRYRFKIVP